LQRLDQSPSPLPHHHYPILLLLFLLLLPGHGKGPKALHGRHKLKCVDVDMRRHGSAPIDHLSDVVGCHGVEAFIDILGLLLITLLGRRGG